MDIKVVTMPKLSRYLLMLGIPLCFASQPLYAADAEQFLCGGTQASTNELPKLNSDCPIGKGLWGNSPPKGKNSSFWIQCGLLTKPMPLSRAKVLYQHISTHIWMKPEGSDMRCLIGPYDDYDTAKKELAGVRTEKLYKEAFIREVRKGVKEPVTQPKPKTAPVKKPEQPKPAEVVKVAPVANQPVSGTDISKMPQPESDGAMISIRRQATIGGLTYAVPHVMDTEIQFYMEHDLAWNRMSYEDALATCQRQNMRLATEEEWAQLLSSKVMEKDQWPVYLPYWGAGNKGLFTTGKVNSLKGTSLLNVLCVNTNRSK